MVLLIELYIITDLSTEDDTSETSMVPAQGFVVLFTGFQSFIVTTNELNTNIFQLILPSGLYVGKFFLFLSEN